MKNLIISVVVAAFSVAAIAAETNATEAVRHKKPSAQVRKARRAQRIAEAGGLVAKPYKGKYVYIVNDQKRVAEKDFFAEDGKSIGGLFQYPVRIVPPKTELERPGLTITISDNDQAPSILIAPEIPWAGINVRALAADNPKPEVLVSRLQKEIWRAFMFACGAANSVMQPCVMRQVSCNADLDRHTNIVPCPDSLPRIFATAQILGIESPYSCTYREACQQGWAPQLTNDVQKAIWDKAHEIPSKPIKIEYNEKRDKGK